MDKWDMTQREIKFRAWVETREAMVTVTELGFLTNGELHDFKSDDLGGFSVVLSSSVGQTVKLMQFTGLKDKNGKEIYEGDICENGDWVPDAHAYSSWQEVVEWTEGDAGFRGIYPNGDGMECVVIGNIYENPELLVQPTK